MKNTINHILVFLFISMPLLTHAQTIRYVSDELEITMRNGQGVKYAIRRILKSGTRLEVLETQPSGYSKVRIANGDEGWVLTRFLSNTPSAKKRLLAREQRIANLELEIVEHKEEIKNLNSKNSNVAAQNQKLKKKAQRLSKELDDLHRTASSAVALDNENKKLKEKLQQIDRENQSLIMENNALKNNNTRSWFFIGAGVLLSGILLGLILPSLRIRKKDNWSKL